MKFKRLKEGVPLFATFSAVLTVGILFFWFTKAEAILDAPPGAEEYTQEAADLDAIIAAEGEAPIVTTIPVELEETIAAQEEISEIEATNDVEPATTNTTITTEDSTAESTSDEPITLSLDNEKTTEAIYAIGGAFVGFFMLLGISYVVLKRKQ